MFFLMALLLTPLLVYTNSGKIEEWIALVPPIFSVIPLCAVLHFETTLWRKGCSLEEGSFPGTVRRIRSDPWLRGILFFTLFLLLTSLALSALVFVQKPLFALKYFIVWFVLYALSFDLLLCYRSRALRLLNPESEASEEARHALQAILKGDDTSLWRTIDHLAEVAVRAAQTKKLSLGTQALASLEEIIEHFFKASKSISRLNDDASVEAQTGNDEMSYTLVTLLERLELIFDQSLAGKMEPFCRKIILQTGKMMVAAAAYDMSLVPLPARMVSKFGLKGMQYNVDEFGVLATATLVESAKRIIREVPLQYTEIEEPFCSIIQGIGSIARSTFKKNKSTSISLLIEPLEQLKQAIQDPAVATHRDFPKISSSLEGVLGEFSALSNMLQTLPNIDQQ